MKRHFVLLAVIVFFFLLFGLLPIIVLIISSVQEFLASDTDLIAYLLKKSNVNLIKNSLYLSLIVSVISLSVGVFFGTILWGVQLRFKKLFKLSLLIPLIIPPYIYSICFERIFYKESLLGSFLAILGLGEQTIQSILHGMTGTAIVLCGIFIPITSLVVSTLFSRISSSMIDAARTCSSDFKVMFRIVLPFSKHGLMSIFFVIFLLTLAQMEVPNVFSLNVIPFEILTQFAAFHNYPLSMMASLPLFLLSLMIFMIEVILIKKSDLLVQKVKLGTINLFHSNRTLFSLSLFTFILILIYLPIGNLFSRSLSLTFMVQLISESRTEIWNSLYLSFLGAAFLTLFGLIMALLKTDRRFPFKSSIDFLSIFSFIFPNIILGLALILFWNQESSLFSFFYTSFLIILFAYLFHFNIFPQRILSDHLRQLPRSIEEAGMLAGAGKMKRILFLILPNIKESIITSFLLSFLFCLGEIGTTIFIYPPGLQTLPIKIFTMGANSPEHVVSGLAVILILLILIPAISILVLQEIRRKYVHH